MMAGQQEVNMNREITHIKQTGKLVAISTGWQYWLVDGVLYSVSVTGANYNVWCAVSRLNAHLHRLFQITGKRFFTESPDTVVLDRQFISQFSYA